ncbi:MAG: hypothetical protein V1929_03530 [bacterium]
MLHFVENSRVFQQRLRIGPRGCQGREVVEGAVGVTTGQPRLVLEQGALADLPQPGEHHHWQLL